VIIVVVVVFGHQVDRVRGFEEAGGVDCVQELVVGQVEEAQANEADEGRVRYELYAVVVEVQALEFAQAVEFVAEQDL
jgi:hypothetical protein